MSDTKFDELEEAYGIPAVHLLRGVLYRDQTDAWNLLLRHRLRLEAYFQPLRLQLFIDEAEGYAYLRQQIDEEDDFPRLMSRRRLTYPQTLLLLLLRKRLLEFEAAGNESRLVLSEGEMIDMVRLYWADSGTNERKREDQVVATIKKLVTFKFLSPIKQEKDKYELRRIIKAYLPAEDIATMLDTLQKYHRERFGQEEENEVI
ncbi:MAG: DUF4194 domain-containing protein [Bacteroidota bacterium]